jgi:hypothetical protein
VETLSEATAAARRNLTLDLFTKHGPFWAAIVGLREEWGIAPVTAIPPFPPPGSAVAVGLVNALQMPERFHLPPEPEDRVLIGLKELDARHPGLMLEEICDYMRAIHPRVWVGTWVLALRDVLADLDRIGTLVINPSGTDALAWQRWLPFVSACACYDPPANDLIAFAGHDHRPLDAMEATERTFWRDPEMAERAEQRFAVRLLEIQQQPGRDRLSDVLAAYLELAVGKAEAWQPSTVVSPPPRPVGRQPVDPLTAVQCAVFADRFGWTEPRIGDHFGWGLTLDDYGKARRCKQARHHIQKGREILAERAINSR